MSLYTRIKRVGRGREVIEKKISRRRDPNPSNYVERRKSVPVPSLRSVAIAPTCVIQAGRSARRQPRPISRNTTSPDTAALPRAIADHVQILKYQGPSPAPGGCRGTALEPRAGVM